MALLLKDAIKPNLVQTLENNVAFVEHPPKTQTAVGFKARNSLIVRDSTLIVAFVSVKSRGTHDTLNKAALAEKGSIVIQID